MSTFLVRSGRGPKGDVFSVSKTWLSVKLCFIILLIQAVTFPAAAAQNITGLQLHIREQDVVMDNGILQVTLSKPAGMVTGIQYNGVDNLLEILNEDSNRGYWDLVWDAPGIKRKKGEFDRMETTNFTVIVETENQIELSFTRMWDPSLEGKVVPLNIDKRFVMLRNSSGFYTYGIYEHVKDWPAFNLTNTRIVFKLRKDKFHYMAMSDNRQRYMPLPDDRTAERGQPLAYPEAVLLVNPVEPEFKGEVDDKYQYSIENKDNRVHGWISTVTDPPMGFWQITPSEEFKSGGPLKQCLTSHVGPITLAIFHSTHYSGADLILQFGPNEPWKKVFGPVFIHLNSLVNGDDPLKRLWEDAKQQMEVEVQSWPYDFPASKDFPPLDQRGSVSGRLLVHDRYISDEDLPGNGTLVGLAAPGDVGSWQFECKGYQFWTKADEKGCFSITGIRPGTYNLFAYVPGLIGDYRYDGEVTISPGCDKDVGTLVYEPPRSGPTLWEIGIPDRTAAEFFVPDPNPKYINKLYLNHTDRFRQYGLWERYADLYPHNDMVYTVGVSDYRKDFFFAQVTRKTDNNTYQGSTWQIKFKLDIVDKNNTYKLRIALATAHVSDLQVRINDLRPSNPHFSTGPIGNDNTIARHGIHGLYRLYNVDVPGVQLVEGNNTIFLTRTLSTSPFQGIMYDYIRLEGPPSSKGNNLGFSSKFGSMTQEQKFLCSVLDTLEKRTPLQGMEFMGCIGCTMWTFQVLSWCKNSIVRLFEEFNPTINKCEEINGIKHFK